MTPGADEPLVSVIVPVHDNATTLGSLTEQVVSVLRSAGHSYELLLIDDASTDSSWDVIVGLAQADPAVRGLRLAHNVGGGTVRIAGCAAARGTYICTIDADLDYRPADLLGIIDLLLAGNEVVSGVRVDHGGRPVSRQVGSRLLRRLVARTWSFVPRDLGCGLQGWTRELVTLSLPFAPTHRDFLWAVPLFGPARTYAELEITDHGDSRSSYPLLAQAVRITLMALLIWQGLATALLVTGVAVIAAGAMGTVGFGAWWLLGGPLWPTVSTLVMAAGVGLPLVLAGLVQARVDRMTAAATPPYVLRATTS